MSDPLAIAFEETIGTHCAQWIDEGSAECSCGHQFDHKPADDWEAQNMQVRHWCDILAVTARELIAAEISALYDTFEKEGQSDEMLWGLEEAETAVREGPSTAHGDEHDMLRAIDKMEDDVINGLA